MMGSLARLVSGKSLFRVTAMVLVAVAAGIANGVEPRGAGPAWAAPPLAQAISIRESSTGNTISLNELLDQLREADVVFLGESHTDETTHRLQAAIYRGLLDRKADRVVLALEMFDRDVQTYLDDYLQGKIDEQTFLENSRPWSNYHEAYRPLVELAREVTAPVRASNFPSPLLRRVASAGEDALEALSAEERAQVPDTYLPNSPEYWRRVDNVLRSHRAMMPSAGDDDRLYSTQSLWDNAMGDTCAQALDDFPDHLVLHINGKFHSAYGEGAVQQLQLRKPDARVTTVDVVPTANPATEELRGKPPADYVVFVEARATNLDQGKRSVFVGQRIEYRFHLPERASEDSPVPLLIWLHRDGLTAEEAMTLCRKRFGEQVAIVTIESPHRFVGTDLAVGERWYWPDTFAEDAGALVHAVEEIAAYLFRHFPLATDCITVVGEGTGGTVAAVIATQATCFPVAAIAIGPAQYAKVQELPLLLPEYFDDNPLPSRSLLVHGDESLVEWWQDELQQYNEVDVASTFDILADDPWQRQRQATSAVRAALGLDEHDEELSAARQRRYLLVETGEARERHWAELQAHELAASDGIPTAVVSDVPEEVNATRVATAITSDALAQPGVLPRCPGPFGGTTVLVLPPGEDARIDTWLALERDDPLARDSRFHRVRIATQEGDRALPTVLEKLRDENRKNVLIVPATFYAEHAWLRTLHDEVRQLEDTMTLHWLPGLGGRPGVL